MQCFWSLVHVIPKMWDILASIASLSIIVVLSFILWAPSTVWKYNTKSLHWPFNSALHVWRVWDAVVIKWTSSLAFGLFYLLLLSLLEKFDNFPFALSHSFKNWVVQDLRGERGSKRETEREREMCTLHHTETLFSCSQAILYLTLDHITYSFSFDFSHKVALLWMGTEGVSWKGQASKTTSEQTLDHSETGSTAPDH